MKRLALIFSIFAILFAAGGLVISQTIKQNQDEVTIIQNPKTQKPPAGNASRSDAGRQDPKNQINSNSKFQNPNTDISVDPLEIRENPSPDEQVLGSSINEVGKLSVNEATLEELDTIPGVGPVTAQKIIDGRPWEDLEEALKLISTRYRDAAREKLKL